MCDQALLLSSKAPIIDSKMAVTDWLLGRKSTKPTYAVELGLVGLEVAWHVCHQLEPMTAKEAGSLMVTQLNLPPVDMLDDLGLSPDQLVRVKERVNRVFQAKLWGG